MNYEDERWVPVNYRSEEFARRYEVSDRGRVRNRLTGNLLAQRVQTNRYGHRSVTVGLSAAPLRATPTVALLVISSFTHAPAPGEFVKHRDGNVEDNALDNLYVAKKVRPSRADQYASDF